MSSVIDYYSKNSGPGEVRLLCRFYHEPLGTLIVRNVNNLAILGHIALKSYTGTQ